jgi:hypothetical protein
MFSQHIRGEGRGVLCCAVAFMKVNIRSASLYLGYEQKPCILQCSAVQLYRGKRSSVRTMILGLRLGFREFAAGCNTR